jgi:REP element-mobilizing transposase RayT
MGGKMAVNDAGCMVEGWWHESNTKFHGVTTDAFIVMPNHIHGIIITVGADRCVRPHSDTPAGAQGGHAGPPLPRIVQWFKTMTTNKYIRGVKRSGWTPFNRTLWQRGYYEHVVRNDTSLNRIREYITTNPLRWELDRENPGRTGKDEFDCWLTTFTVPPDRVKGR